MIFLKKKKDKFKPGNTFELVDISKFKIGVSYPGWNLKDGATQSMISEFLACRERVRLSYVEGWTSEATSNAITFGSLFHTCLEKIYRFLQLKVDWKGINISNVVDNTLKDFKTDAKIWTPDDETNNILNTGFLKILIPAYCKKYLEKDSKTKWFMVEEEYDTPLNGIRFRGKFDRLQMNKHDEVWVWDTKTKGRIDPTIQDRLSFDLQMMIYITAYESQFKKLPAGFVYDIIQRPALRRGKTETLQHFMERVKGDVDDSYFLRIRMRLDPEEYKRWKKEFLIVCTEFEEWSRKLTQIRNPTACETRYGLCKFIKVCSANDFTGLRKKEKLFSELEEK